MPANANVEGCGGAIFPTVDDYFMFYPEMKGKVKPEYVKRIIAESPQLDKIFKKWCDNHYESLTVDKMLAAYCQFLHTTVSFICLGVKAHNGMNITT